MTCIQPFFAVAWVAMLVLLNCNAGAADPPTTHRAASNVGDNDAQPAVLPAALAALKPQLQGKTPAQVEAIVEKSLGRPTRVIGSGLRIPQWDIGGGVLTVHPLQGPTYRTEHGPIFWLIDTQNLVGSNIIASYEMTTVADPANHGTRFWLGNLDLQPDGHYRFRPSNSFPAEKAKGPSNFFFEHPSGSYSITYPPPLTATSVLEKIQDKATIAALDFTADKIGDDGVKTQMALRVDTNHRRIIFIPASDRRLTFEMERSWDRYSN